MPVYPDFFLFPSYSYPECCDRLVDLFSSDFLPFRLTLKIKCLKIAYFVIQHTGNIAVDDRVFVFRDLLFMIMRPQSCGHKLLNICLFVYRQLSPCRRSIVRTWPGGQSSFRNPWPTRLGRPYVSCGCYAYGTLSRRWRFLRLLLFIYR